MCSMVPMKLHLKAAGIRFLRLILLLRGSAPLEAAGITEVSFYVFN